MVIQGNTFCFGDHVNTDEIIAARYLNRSDMQALAPYLMEDIRPGFGRLPGLSGSILAAGWNFGCGSSREHAPQVIRAAGVCAVVARSFARIFLRNAINIGLPVIQIADTGSISEGDRLEIDMEKGRVINLSQNREYPCEPYPPFLRGIMQEGGWLAYARNLPTILEK